MALTPSLSDVAERYQFKQEDIVMLMDTQGANPMEIPTKANLVRCATLSAASAETGADCGHAQIRGMQWLVRDARPNDSLFFHCASLVVGRRLWD